MDIQTKIDMLTSRRDLLMRRDPVANAKIARKIERQIRKLKCQ